MTHVPKTSVRSLIENKKTPNVKKDEGVLVRGTTFNSSRVKINVKKHIFSAYSTGSQFGNGV